MAAHDSLRQAYEEVLGKVGRNMLLFQQAERLVRRLVALGSLSAKPGNAAECIEKRASACLSMTMGQLVRKFMEPPGAGRRLSPDPSDAADVDSARLSVRFSFGNTDDGQEPRKQTIADLIQERDRLVHHLLPRLDRSSLESCTETAELLDAQRRKILPEIHRLQQNLKAVRADLEIILSHLESADGMEELFLPEIQQCPLIRNLAAIASDSCAPEGWVRLGEAINLLEDFPPGRIKSLLRQFDHDSLTDFLVASQLFEIHLEAIPSGHHRVFYRLKRAPSSFAGSQTAL
jgi:hypothetical protein